jgi:hypothetical protein
MIGWNHLVEIERIEKLSLRSFSPPHYALLPLMTSSPTESRFASRLNRSFATQSEGKRTTLARSRNRLPARQSTTRDTGLPFEAGLLLSGQSPAPSPAQ